MNRRPLDDVESYLEELESQSEITKTPEMEEYERETGKYAIWRGVLTEGFKRWLKGEKIYDRDKERISLYVSNETKERWQEFIEDNNYSTLSKLIRTSVSKFIENHNNKNHLLTTQISSQSVSKISHALKEPLTTIKGYAQLILENNSDEINEDINSTVRNIFDQSILLENKIIQFLDNIKTDEEEYAILLIEDNLATNQLITSYFESKGYKCKGVANGKKGLEVLKSSKPKLILLDIILPDISGYDICETLKNDDEYKDIPIYFLTAITEFEVEKNMKRTKADGYILKPFNLPDFNPIFKYFNNTES